MTFASTIKIFAYPFDRSHYFHVYVLSKFIELLILPYAIICNEYPICKA